MRRFQRLPINFYVDDILIKKSVNLWLFNNTLQFIIQLQYSVSLKFLSLQKQRSINI